MTNENKNTKNYSSLEFWVNLLFQRGILAVAEVAGTLFLFRAVFSPTFEVGAAVTGTILVTLGVVFEYLIWTKTTVFVSRQVDRLDANRKKTADEQMELLKTVLQAMPRGAGGTPVSSEPTEGS